MSIAIDKLKIVQFPAPVLREKARPIAGVTEEIRAVARRMIELMHEARGVGLAAPQVGLSLRLFVANPTGDANDDRVYINPQLVNPSEQTAGAEEGCLSIPGVNVKVMRPVAIRITATNEHGQTISDQSDQLLARIWQHETDHLDGVLILDRMTAYDARSNRRAIAQLEDDYTRAAKR